MVSFKNSSGLGTAFSCPGSSWNRRRSIFGGFSPLARLTSKPSLVSGPWTRAGYHTGAVPQVATRWRQGCLLGGRWAPGPRTAVLARPPLGPGAGCGQRLGSLELGADGGWCGVSASLEGPHCCVLSKRSGLMSATCGTNLQGELSSQTGHLWAGGRIPVAPGGLGSPVWKTRGFLVLRHKASPAENMEPGSEPTFNSEPSCHVS